MSVLRGPADADHYRVKIGRYGDRWYTDPLPTCPIAEASDWQGPSWSIVKGAAGKDWSYVTNKRNGHTPTAELQRIALLEPDARTAAYNAINKAGLGQAGGRGTIVHLWAEDLLAGRSPRTITEPALFTMRLPKAALDEALTFLPALTAFFDHYQPEVIAAEYVALHRDLNGHGYGCTPDVIARIQGQTLGIDWKSRGVDSDHGAYPEEAAQIAAGANAQYMIVSSPLSGNPVRAYLPPVDGGIVVSIRPDGCRIYPIDLAPAWEHVQAMHAFWVARLTEKTAIGKPWPPIAINQGDTLWTSTTTFSPASMTSSEASTSTSAGSKSIRTNSSTPLNSSSPPSKDSERPASPDEFAVTSLALAQAMLDFPEKVIAELEEWWPILTPTPQQVRNGEAVWTEDQIDHIGRMCDLADAPFWQHATPQTRVR